MPVWKVLVCWIGLNVTIQVIADMTLRAGVWDVGRSVADTTLILGTWVCLYFFGRGVR